MKKILIVSFFLLALSLAGQQVQGLSSAGSVQKQSAYDEKEIIKKQAERYSARRKYEQAITLYRELMENYPEDWEIVESLLTDLLRISNYQEADEILNQKKDILPQYNYLKFKIPLLIRNGETHEAFKLGDKYLDEYKNNVNVYQDMSRLYSSSRQYEKAAQVLERARKVTNDEYLFTLDLARSYQNQSKNHKAAAEYLKHLERNKNYLHYVMNNLKGILNRDETVIKTVKQASENTDSKEVLEAYALSLAHLKDYQNALIEYQNLDENKLLNFAEELNKMKNYNVALNAYQQYELRVNEPDLIAEVQIAKADIYIKLNQYNLAENELKLVYNNNKLQKGKYRYRTQAAKISRLMLADLSIRMNSKPDVVINYLNEAAKYALNDMQRKEIEFAVIDFRLKTGDLDTAGKQLAEMLTDEEPGTDIYKQSLYYTWQIALMQQDSQADSLLGELILNLPDSELTTKALYLTQIISSLPEEFHTQLFAAWRLHGLYKYKEALEILSEIHQLSGDDEIQLLAAEWQQVQDSSLADKWWLHDFENELLAEYANLQIMQTSVSDSLKRDYITDFLKENPQSIFAPQFRNELSNIIEGE